MLRGSNKQTINKENRSTTEIAVKEVKWMVEGVDDDGANRIQENDDNTFGCPGATGVARPGTERTNRRTQQKDDQQTSLNLEL